MKNGIRVEGALEVEEKPIGGAPLVDPDVLLKSLEAVRTGEQVKQAILEKEERLRLEEEDEKRRSQTYAAVLKILPSKLNGLIRELLETNGKEWKATINNLLDSPDPYLQIRVRWAYARELVRIAVEGGGNPKYKEVVKRLDDLGLLFPAKNPKKAYTVGETSYGVEVPPDYVAVAEEVIKLLNVLIPLSDDCAKQERRNRRAEFMKSVTVRDPLEFFNREDPAVGVGIFHVPPYTFSYMSKGGVRYGKDLGGDIRVRSDGENLWFEAGLGHVEKKTEEARLASIVVPVFQVVEKETIEFAEEQGRLPRKKRWLLSEMHRSLRQAYLWLNQRDYARKRAAISSEDFLLHGKAGTAFLSVPFYRIENPQNPQKSRQWYQPWILAERTTGGKILLCDAETAIAEHFPDTCRAVASEGKDFDGLAAELQRYLKVVKTHVEAGVKKAAAVARAEREAEEQIKGTDAWREKQRRDAEAEQRRGFLDSLTAEEREQALEVERAAREDTGDDEEAIVGAEPAEVSGPAGTNAEEEESKGDASKSAEEPTRARKPRKSKK